MPDFTNRVRFTHKDGKNLLVVNGEDITDKVGVRDFSITLDPETLRPVLRVSFDLDQIDVDLNDSAVESA